MSTGRPRRSAQMLLWQEQAADPALEESRQVQAAGGHRGQALAGKPRMVMLYWEMVGQGVLALLSSTHPWYQLSSPRVKWSFQHVTTCDVSMVTISQTVSYRKC